MIILANTITLSGKVIGSTDGCGNFTN